LAAGWWDCAIDVRFILGGAERFDNSNASESERDARGGDTVSGAEAAYSVVQQDPAGPDSKFGLENKGWPIDAVTRGERTMALRSGIEFQDEEK